MFDIGWLKRLVGIWDNMGCGGDGIFLLLGMLVLFKCWLYNMIDPRLSKILSADSGKRNHLLIESRLHCACSLTQRPCLTKILSYLLSPSPTPRSFHQPKDAHRWLRPRIRRIQRQPHRHFLQRFRRSLLARCRYRQYCGFDPLFGSSSCW